MITATGIAHAPVVFLATRTNIGAAINAAIGAVAANA
jgi:hypothetical protein